MTQQYAHIFWFIWSRLTLEFFCFKKDWLYLEISCKTALKLNNDKVYNHSRLQQSDVSRIPRKNAEFYSLCSKNWQEKPVGFRILSEFLNNFASVSVSASFYFILPYFWSFSILANGILRKSMICMEIKMHSKSRLFLKRWNITSHRPPLLNVGGIQSIIVPFRQIILFLLINMIQSYILNTYSALSAWQIQT